MSNNNKKILLIEDDRFLSKMLSKMLESHQYEVALAVSGREGLLKASTKNPDLILLDLILPDINGFDILETIKKEEATKRIPIIIITNLGQPEDIAQAKSLGVKDYLVKSDIKLEEVIEKVRKYLPLSNNK